MTAPKGEEVITFASIESLSHLLNALRAVLGETTLQLAIGVMHDVFVEHVRRVRVALLLQVLQDCAIYVLLRRREVV